MDRIKSAFDIAPEMLARLTPAAAVESFRDLLWAESRRTGIDPTMVHISSRTDVKDAGVDASIDRDAKPRGNSSLLAAGTRYQVKTGAATRPWQRSWINRELFGPRESPLLENLAPAVRRCMEEGQRYVLVCFGIDPTPEDQLVRARENLVAAFAQCGFDNPHVDVWGQTHLVGLMGRFPSLCLRIADRDEWAMQSHSSWSLAVEMQVTPHFEQAQLQMVESIRSFLRSDGPRHLRLLGEPGVGKSRLAFEATSAEDIAPLTLYVTSGEEFQKGALFNSLLRPDNDFHVVLVIDECPPADRASIWNHLRNRSDRVRLITIDHGPERIDASDAQIVNVPPLKEEAVREIISDYVPAFEAYRWAEFCQGSPRVAHVVGQNLKNCPTDLLTPPSHVDIWERYVCGHDKPDSESVALRRIVLRYIALFERFGFEPPVEDEARFIAKLAAEADERISWAKFQDIVVELKQRRVLQGARTLYIAPRLFQVFLYRDFWQRHGRGFDLVARFADLPDSLWQWFANMLPYAHTSEVAEDAVEKLLQPDGIFADDAALETQAGARLLRVLAEAKPREALACLKRTIGTWELERLLRLTDGRQWLVWAIEIIAVWEELFLDAAELLLTLAEAENATNSNNASGTFTSLFCLQPGCAATQAAPAVRIYVLRNALHSSRAERRAVALRACAHALSFRADGRVVGPEYQGLRPNVPFWQPKTNNEVLAAYQDVWETTAEHFRTGPAEDRIAAAKALLDSAGMALTAPPLIDHVIDLLADFPRHPNVDQRHFVEVLNWLRRSNALHLSAAQSDKLQRIDEKLTGTEFSSRLRRRVTLRQWDDDRDEQGQHSDKVKIALEQLADEAIEDRGKLRSELHWLAADTTGNSFGFGYILGKRDQDMQCADDIVEARARAGGRGTAAFIGGYFAGVFERNAADWERRLFDYSRDSESRLWFGDVAATSGFSPRIAERAIELGEQRALPAAQFACWRMGRRLGDFSPNLLARMITMLITGGTTEGAVIALGLCHAYYCDSHREVSMPEETTLTVLTNPALFVDRNAARIDYDWSQVADKYVEQYPHRAVALLGAVINHCDKNCKFFTYSDYSGGRTLPRIIERHPRDAWRVIADALGDLKTTLAWEIQRWLEQGPIRVFGDLTPGPIVLLPQADVWIWVDEDPGQRARWLAGALPRTLDATYAGQFTREFIIRYSANEGAMDSLFGQFISGGWCGPDSLHYRKRRDEARTWIGAETDLRVRTWVQGFIGYLDRQIERAELREEREY